jgi:hypothetical protein
MSLCVSMQFFFSMLLFTIIQIKCMIISLNYDKIKSHINFPTFYTVFCAPFIRKCKEHTTKKKNNMYCNNKNANEARDNNKTDT